MRGDLQKIEEVLPTLEDIDTSTIWSSDGHGSFREKLAVEVNDCYFCNYNPKNKDVFDIIRNIPEGATRTYFKAWDNKEIVRLNTVSVQLVLTLTANAKANATESEKGARQRFHHL